VAWASASGIVGGYGNGVFGTNDPMTHEQVVTILWRYDGSKTPEGELAFTDAGAIHDYALPAVRRAVENGIATDWAGDNFSPDDGSTRAEMAAMFYCYLTNCDAPGGANPDTAELEHAATDSNAPEVFILPTSALTV